MDKSTKAAQASAKKSPAPKKSPRTANKSGSTLSADSTTQKLSDVVPGAKVTVQKKQSEPKPKPETAKTATKASSSGNFLDFDWAEAPAPAPKAAAASVPAPASTDDDGWTDDWSFGSAPGDTAFAAARA